MPFSSVQTEWMVPLGHVWGPACGGQVRTIVCLCLDGLQKSDGYMCVFWGGGDELICSTLRHRTKKNKKIK